MHPKRKRHVLEHAEVSKQSTTLEQHAHLLPQAIKSLTLEPRHILSGHGDGTGVRP